MEQSTEGTILQITLHPEIEKLLSKKKPNNCKTGERQTVYPIKTHKDIIAMANWLYEHKNNKYVLAFTLGINLGLRANELLDLKMNQVFSPDGSVRLIEDEEDTSDGIDIYQSKTKKHRTVFLKFCFDRRFLALHSDKPCKCTGNVTCPRNSNLK